MTQLRFIGELPVWIGLIVSAIVCVLAWRYYRRESFNLPGYLVWLLPLLRALAFFLGIMILTGPVLHHRKTVGEPGRVRIYVDGSQSMAMTDPQMSDSRKLSAIHEMGWTPQAVKLGEAGSLETADESLLSAVTRFDKTTRWQRAMRGLIGESSNNVDSDSIFARLKKTNDVEIILLNGIEMIKLADSKTPDDVALEFPELPTAPLTDLSSQFSSSQKASLSSGAIEDASKSQTAVVLVTDGQHNSGPSPIQMARVLGGQGVQFYPVAIGAVRPAPDLALLSVDYPELVFRKDTVRGSLKIRDALAAGHPFVVQISNDKKVLWQKQLVTVGNTERDVDFEFKIEELVEQASSKTDGLVTEVQQHTVPLRLSASIIPLEQESETANNAKAMRIAAIAQSHKLLILDGRSRWETRYLRNAFERDTQWSVDTAIAGPGNDEEAMPRGEKRNQFPGTKNDLFKYDLIIFGEISKQLFSEQEFKWLREFVSLRGGGIVFIDGSRNKLRELGEEDLAPLLPVKWVDEAIQTRPLTRPMGLTLTDKGASLPALRMAAEKQKNLQFWNELPPPRKFSRVECLAGAEVLAEIMVDNSRAPAIVTRSYGAGRVLFLAFDETWRWRYKTADTYHQRIWNQLARLAMPRPFSSSDEFVSIDTGKLSYDNNETIGVRIRLTDNDGNPVSESTVDALVWKDGRTVSSISLTADPDVPGIYRGDSGSLPSGDYEVSVRASGFSDEAFKARGEFTVEPRDSGELQNTATNETLLREMAAESGGTFLREENFSRLPEILAPLSNGFIVESETVLWQSYWWFAAIVMLLATEWILRKRAGLL